MEGESTNLVISDKRRVDEAGEVKQEVGGGVQGVNHEPISDSGATVDDSRGVLEKVSTTPETPDVAMPAQQRPPQIAELRRMALAQFKKGQKIQMGRVVLEVKKLTNKDVVLRPIGMMMPRIPQQEAVATPP